MVLFLHPRHVFLHLWVHLGGDALGGGLLVGQIGEEFMKHFCGFIIITRH